MLNQTAEDQSEDQTAEDKRELIFYSTVDIAKMLGCSIPTVRTIFHRRDFPAFKAGKNLKVERSAFLKWCGERRADQ